jgi:hypothetical protein
MADMAKTQVGLIVTGTDGKFPGTGTMSGRDVANGGGYVLTVSGQAWLNIGLSGRETTIIQLLRGPTA